MTRAGRRNIKLSLPIDDLFVNSIRESVAIKEELLSDALFFEMVRRTGEEIVAALESGHKIFFFGNGGSAADAQHLAAEFVGRFEWERPGLPAIALTTNTSTLTAIGNDYGNEKIFARQLETLACSGDVAVGISTSGKSPSVLAALRVARSKNLVGVGMTGRQGGEMCDVVQYCIKVPSDRTARIQEVHIFVGHVLCEFVDRSISKKSGSG